MINFRYHIVSLMAVFIALSVGIAVGVSLSPSVDQGIREQAEADRKQVTALRSELDRVKSLASYRDAYEARIGAQTTQDLLNGVRVAVVSMPDAPSTTASAVRSAAEQAGATIVRDVRVSAEVFEADGADAIDTALEPWLSELRLDAKASPATKIGQALARAVADHSAPPRDDKAAALADLLVKGGWVSLSRGSQSQAQLVLVVTAKATPDQPPSAKLRDSHLAFDLALKSRAAVVLAGPNSEGVDGTDVLAARSDPAASGQLSTVDVADLPSGVTTTILAGREQLNGAFGQHYGALARAGAPLPDLPIR